MNDSQLCTIPQVRQFLCDSESLAFIASSLHDDVRYDFIPLRRFDYVQLNKPDKGVSRQCLMRTTGYGHAQITCPIIRTLLQAFNTPLRKCYRAPGAGDAFLRKYSAEDITTFS